MKLHIRSAGSARVPAVGSCCWFLLRELNLYRRVSHLNRSPETVLWSNGRRILLKAVIEVWAILETVLEMSSSFSYIQRIPIGIAPCGPHLRLISNEALYAKRLALSHSEPAHFGSALHGTDQDGSDLDLLVDALPGTTLFDLGGLQVELESLLGVRVDLPTPADLPPKFRNRVLAEAQPI